jgi:hypothetical protein
MFEEKLDFKQALILAKQLGFCRVILHWMWKARCRKQVDPPAGSCLRNYFDPHKFIQRNQFIHTGDAEVAAEKHYQIKPRPGKIINGKVAASHRVKG